MCPTQAPCHFTTSLIVANHHLWSHPLSLHSVPFVSLLISWDERDWRRRKKGGGVPVLSGPTSPSWPLRIRVNTKPTLLTSTLKHPDTSGERETAAACQHHWRVNWKRPSVWDKCVKWLPKAKYTQPCISLVRSSTSAHQRFGYRYGANICLSEKTPSRIKLSCLSHPEGKRSPLHFAVSPWHFFFIYSDFLRIKCLTHMTSVRFPVSLAFALHVSRFINIFVRLHEAVCNRLSLVIETIWRKQLLCSVRISDFLLCLDTVTVYQTALFHHENRH